MEVVNFNLNFKRSLRFQMGKMYLCLLQRNCTQVNNKLLRIYYLCIISICVPLIGGSTVYFK